MKKFTLLCLGLFTALTIQAQIIHVPGDYPTIQQGINAATPGDTVLVADGIYYEQINFLGKKPLMVASEFLMDGDTSHIGNTIIDGSQLTDLDSASVVYFLSGEDTTSILCGFTIQHGEGTFYITPQNWYRSGGGIFVSRSGAKIIHNHITENHLNDTLHGNPQIVEGAGLSCEWADDSKWIVVEGNVIDHNSCYSSGTNVSGAGLSICYNSRIANNTISWNTTTGGGTCYSSGTAFSLVNDPTWTIPDTAIVEHNIITNNLAESEHNGAHSAGGLFNAVSGIFEDNFVAYNEVITGILLNGGCAGFLAYDPREGTVVRGNTFTENISNTNVGAVGFQPLIGGTSEPSTVLVENNYFFGNEGYTGGALGSFDTPLIIQNNVFRENHASLGGAVYLIRQWAPVAPRLAVLINNSFSGNKADMYGGAFFSNKSNPLLLNSVLWNDSSSMQNSYEIYVLSTDTAEIAFSNIDAGKINGNWTDGGGNINANPLFEDLDSLTISQNSPCYNTGTSAYTCQYGETHNSPVYDIIGKARPWHGSPDIGAYEYHNTVGIDNGYSGSGFSCSNQPNPFTTSTTFTYSLKEPCKVIITVFNNVGQVVGTPVNGYQQKGEQKVVWNAETLPTGMYYFRIKADGMAASGKVIKM